MNQTVSSLSAMVDVVHSLRVARVLRHTRALLNWDADSVHWPWSSIDPMMHESNARNVIHSLRTVELQCATFEAGVPDVFCTPQLMAAAYAMLGVLHGSHGRIRAEWATTIPDGMGGDGTRASLLAQLLLPLDSRACGPSEQRSSWWAEVAAVVDFVSLRAATAPASPRRRDQSCRQEWVTLHHWLVSLWPDTAAAVASGRVAVSMAGAPCGTLLGHLRLGVSMVPMMSPQGRTNVRSWKQRRLTMLSLLPVWWARALQDRATATPDHGGAPSKLLANVAGQLIGGCTATWPLCKAATEVMMSAMASACAALTSHPTTRMAGRLHMLATPAPLGVRPSRQGGVGTGLCVATYWLLAPWVGAWLCGLPLLPATLSHSHFGAMMSRVAKPRVATAAQPSRPIECKLCAGGHAHVPLSARSLEWTELALVEALTGVSMQFCTQSYAVRTERVGQPLYAQLRWLPGVLAIRHDWDTEDEVACRRRAQAGYVALEVLRIRGGMGTCCQGLPSELNQIIAITIALCTELYGHTPSAPWYQEDYYD